MVKRAILKHKTSLQYGIGAPSGENKAMNAQRWKIAALILLVAFVSLLVYTFVQNKFAQEIDPGAVVLQVQKLSQLVTVRYRIQRVVTMTEQKEPVGEDSILLMVEGEVQGGVDLHNVTAANVTTDAQGIQTIELPAPAILGASLDEKKTKVWDRHITWWTPWVSYDPDLEHKARLKALDDIRQAALDMGILKQAETNTRSAVQDLFAALGWKVKVKIHGLD
jgi:Protein of unknown function (DUF4230)